MVILVSACLLGVGCRYDGQSRPSPAVLSLLSRHTLIPVCPEVLGGLPTPRPPAEQQGDRVVNRLGQDVTDAYRRGAEQTLLLARLYDAKVAILKAKSPSCGKGLIYDGSFSGHLVSGDGISAALLRASGLRVLSEQELTEQCLQAIEDEIDR